MMRLMHLCWYRVVMTTVLLMMELLEHACNDQAFSGHEFRGNTLSAKPLSF